MADGAVPLQAVDDGGAREVVADEPHAALGVELLPVVGDDAARLLTTVLQRVQAERGDGRGIGVAKNAEDPAFLAESVIAIAQITGTTKLLVAKPLVLVEP